MDKIPQNSMESACKADLCALIWRLERLQERWQGFVWLLCPCLFGAFPALAAPPVPNVSYCPQRKLQSATWDAVGVGDLRPVLRDMQRVVTVVRQQRATSDVPVKLLLVKPECQQARMTSASYD